ncbi:hypothetical protein Pla123a_17280 [Posidoniimonas polymericola]|uniref:Four helix bundle protein n=1 Tax=Posidoniimonas polymericola TaxID=2528002 RepID=A0A5C5YSK0_9BACT|nr:four helix bundle protein [Posidoniimonas polymericola]TWT77929.1 hypothetical protein Pla123a_17280 [Posidoniimonas polymericola]
MSNPDKGYRRLDAWQSSLELVHAIREISLTAPEDRPNGIAVRMRRLSASVPRQLAKGYGQEGKEYRAHVVHARQTLAELEDQIAAAVRHGYLSPQQTCPAQRRAERIGSLLNCMAMALEHC